MGEQLTGDVDAAYLCITHCMDCLEEADMQLNNRMAYIIKDKTHNVELVSLSEIRSRLQIMYEDLELISNRFGAKQCEVVT